MTAIKTAISIDEEIYDKVESMTKQLHISRSQFFAQAATYMIERNNDLELLRKINEAYSSIEETDTEVKQKKGERTYHKKRVDEQWK